MLCTLCTRCFYPAQNFATFQPDDVFCNTFAVQLYKFCKLHEFTRLLLSATNNGPICSCASDAAEPFGTKRKNKENPLANTSWQQLSLSPNLRLFWNVLYIIFKTPSVISQSRILFHKIWACRCRKIRPYTKRTFYFFLPRFRKMAIGALSEIGAAALGHGSFQVIFSHIFLVPFEALICINWFLSHGMSYLLMWRSLNFRRIRACFSFPCISSAAFFSSSGRYWSFRSQLIMTGRQETCL